MDQSFDVAHIYIKSFLNVFLFIIKDDGVYGSPYSDHEKHHNYQNKCLELYQQF